MEKDTTKRLIKVIRIDESKIHGHLDEMIRDTVKETLNALLDAKTDKMCKAQRYELSPDRVDTVPAVIIANCTPRLVKSRSKC